MVEELFSVLALGLEISVWLFIMDASAVSVYDCRVF